jgi:hypothetical protein
VHKQKVQAFDWKRHPGVQLRLSDRCSGESKEEALQVVKPRTGPRPIGARQEKPAGVKPHLFFRAWGPAGHRTPISSGLSRPVQPGFNAPWLHVGVSKLVRLLPLVSSKYDYHFPPDTKFARHAMAIDEYRQDFLRVPWGGSGTVPDGSIENVPRFSAPCGVLGICSVFPRVMDAGRV